MPHAEMSDGHRRVRAGAAHRLIEGFNLPFALAIGMLLRLAGLTLTSDQAFLDTDGADYHAIAANLAAGRGYSVSEWRWFEPHPDGSAAEHPDLHRPPLLPALGAVLHFLPGPWMVSARLVSALLGTGCVLLLFRLTKELAGRRAALLAAWILAVYPYAIFYSCKWSTESLCMFCALAGLGSLARWRFRGPAHGMWGGAFIGLAGLARSTSLPLLIVLAGWIAAQPRRDRWRFGVVFIGGALLVLAPWMVRNALLTGVPSPASSFGPYNAWLGMNDRMYDMYSHGESPAFASDLHRLYTIDSRRHVDAMERQGLFAVDETNRYWMNEITSYVRHEPARAATILMRRLAHFFRPWPNRATTPGVVFWAALLSSGPVLCLALAGWLRARETRSGLLVLPALTTVAVSLLFIFHLRFRYPVFDPCMIVAASVALAKMLQPRAGRPTVVPGDRGTATRVQ